jgi:CRISPR-associated protein Cas1
LHQEFYKRKSLVCDIIEPFRPIVDYKIRKMINLGQTKDYKFTKYKEQYQLKWESSSQFIALILEEINEYKSHIFDFIQQYYRWFMKGDIIEKFPRAVLINDNS